MPFIPYKKHDLLCVPIKPLPVYINLHTIQYTTVFSLELDESMRMLYNTYIFIIIMMLYDGRRKTKRINTNTG